MAPAAHRPVRVGGSSGGFSDRTRAIKDLANTGDVDIIVGDWLSEMTMTIHGSGKQKNIQANQGKTLSWEEEVSQAMFAENFMDCFIPAIDALHTNGVKLAVNAGASDTKLLAQLCQKKCEEKGWNAKVAWIEGDDVNDIVMGMIQKGEGFKSIITAKNLNEWGLKPVVAQAYVGGLGIARALTEGADIVIAGRVSDSSPIIAAAAWWHQWNADQFDELAGALMIGHLLECAAYVSGGYSSDFKDLMKTGKHINCGFPIAAIDHKGEAIMFKEKNTGGVISVNSVTSQLLYEIQGPLYYNCDVTADITNIKIEAIAEDQVKISGVKGIAPPPTTKVAITAFAGWQAEYHVYFCGLDIEEKCKWTEDQIRYEMGQEMIDKFDCLKFMQNGTSPIDARNQDVASVDFRIFGQTKDRDLLRMRNPFGFFRVAMTTFLQSAPGASLGNDFRQAEGKPYYTVHPSTLPQESMTVRTHLLWNDKTIDIPKPPKYGEYLVQQPTYETSNPVSLDSFGPTVRLPLGKIVLGRSGDKVSNCNAGFFVRHDDEWEWLRSFFTVAKLRELMGPEEDKGKRIDRFEMKNIKAVHFFLNDHLDRGYDACSTYDTLGKNFMEYIRAKTVDLPKKFVDRGTV